ncbi:Chromatin structure-remodeling complex protein rsc9, partial [Tulasnella sp. 403]
MNAALGYGRPAQVADGHEQWFLDESPKNRMVLALLSGVDDEISWSLFRLGHLSHQHGQRFFIQPFFGLTDALMEWPFWYIRENGGFKDTRPDALGGQTDNWFISADIQKKRKHALESLLILRNASFEQGNAVHLITNHTQRTLALLAGLQSLPNIPLHAEFILHLADIFHGLAAHIVLPPLTLQTHIPKPTIPLNTICNLVSTTKDRSLVIALLNGLAQLFNHNNNSGY